MQRALQDYSTALNTAELQRDTEVEPSLATHPREGPDVYFGQRMKGD